MAPISKLFLVSGEVQGVGFRAFVRKRAMALGLRGYAKNLSGGDVEVLAMGTKDALDKLSGFLHQGPPWAVVRSVQEREAASVRYDEFFIE